MSTQTINTLSDKTSFLSEKTINRWFFYFCVLHLLVWVLAPTLIYKNPPTDSLEGIAWGNLWLLGYEKHPFLAPWLSAGFTDLFGVVGFPIYLLSQLSIAACFWAVFRLAKEFLKPSAAFASVLLLEGINYYNVQSAIFDPNVLMLPFWAFTCLYFYFAITKQRWFDWILVGIFTGLGMLAKYETGMLIILLGLLMLSTTETRKLFKTKGPYLALIVAFLIFLPNLYWLCLHQFDAIHYALGEMQTAPTTPVNPFIHALKNTFNFILEQIGNLLPLLFLYIPFYAAKKMMRPDISIFQRNFLWAIAAGPTFITILLALTTSADLVSRWSFPFFSFIGLVLIFYHHPEVTERRLKQLINLVVIYNIILILGMIIYFLVMPMIKHKATHSDTFPGNHIATFVTQNWQKEFHTPLPYAVGTHHVVVNIAAFSKDKPISFFDFSTKESPWININEVNQKGGVFVIWLQNPDTAIPLQTLKLTYPKLQTGKVYYFNRLTYASKVKPVAVWIAFLPSKSTNSH